MKSKLTKIQKLTVGPKIIDYHGEKKCMSVFIRFDDECGNGHNTFSITAEIRRLIGEIPAGIESCGCLHDDIEKYFPELSHLIKWHLCSTDGPMHYIANTVYWAKEGKLDCARNSAIWLSATDDDLSIALLAHNLKDRLPKLISDFKTEMERLGLTW